MRVPPGEVEALLEPCPGASEPKLSLNGRGPVLGNYSVTIASIAPMTCSRRPSEIGALPASSEATC